LDGHEDALYVLGSVCESVGSIAVPAAVLLDSGNNGMSYISEELAKDIPGATRAKTHVESIGAHESIFVCTERITFWLLLADHNQPMMINALVSPKLQYDIILSVQDIARHGLVDFLGDKIKSWFKESPEDNWNHMGSVAAVQIISDDGEDGFGSAEAFPLRTDQASTPDMPHFEGPERLQHSFAQLVDQFDEIFKDTVSDKPARVTPFDLKLLPGAVMPKAMRAKARIHCLEHENSIEDQVKELSRLGVVKQFNGDFYSQVLLVRKSDGALRFCIDFRFLNKISQDMKWPLPCIHTMLRRVGKHKYFSVLDLTSGYHQCPMTARAQKLTSFITARGLHHFTRLPFGLKGAPSYFQHVMSYEVLKDLCFVICEVYIDDIIIYGDTEEEILERTAQVFNRFREFNIHIKRSKCRFGLESIQYVGHILSKSGISMSEERKAAVLGIPRPETVGQLRTFLGMTGYFRQFIQNYAHIVGPLHTMNSSGNKNKGKALQWTSETDSNFQALRLAIHNAAKIEHLNPTGQVKLYTDASNYAIGAHLVQLDDEGKERTISFASQLLNKIERNWSVTDKEMFAVIMAVKKFNLFVGGRPFVVMIDHNNLQYWQTASASAKVERWRQLLSVYDITYEFLPGTKNVVADAMSRLIPQSVQVAAVTSRAIICSDQQVVPTPPDISQYHSGPAGHFKFLTTMKKLRAAGINYPDLEKHVRMYIKSCDICQRLSSRKSIQGHTYSLQESLPDEVVSVDAMGPINEDRFGYKYVLVFIDNMSKFTRLYPVRSTQAEECAPRLLEYICKDGLPKKLHSDGGSQFVNYMITELAKYINVKMTFSTAYSSEENGIVERVIKDVRAQLQSYCIERKEVKDWSLILPLVERLINTKINDRTGHTPAALKFGRQNALELPPFDVLPGNAHVFNTASEFLESISKFQAVLIAKHAESLKINQSELNRPETTRNFHLFKAGDLILVDHEDRHKSQLLETLRSGPFLVRDQSKSIVTYEDHFTNRVKSTHISKCHEYHPRGSVADALSLTRELQDKYEVESVVSHKFEPKTSKAQKAVHILVKWTGYAEPEWNTIHNNATLRNNIHFIQYARQHADLIKFIPKNVTTEINTK
jgi:hypothetical protein